MRIGLISDTHIPWVQQKLPSEVMDVFKGVDLILHAGDIYSHNVLDELEQIAPVLAALGDDDYPGPDVRVKEKHVIKIDDLVIWLMHEGPYISPSSLWFPMWLKQRILPGEEFVKPDIIISGHEHRAFIDHSDGIVHVNSGSATYLGYRKGLGTIGILETKSKMANIQVMHLDDPKRCQDECLFQV
jgi:putative phosphoesterase